MANNSAKAPFISSNADDVVQAIIDKVGNDIVIGLPLGLGKPNNLANAVYRRAKADPSINLRILSALSLEKPKPAKGLEAAFMGPILERVFGDYPDLDYIKDLREKTLPKNVEIREFFLPAGGFLTHSGVQQNYISTNYTHAVRDLLRNGVNVIGQLIAKREIDGELFYSLSCNTDTSLELVPVLREQEKAGKKVAVVGEVNNNLPFMINDAQVPASTFDCVLDKGSNYYTLFAPPNQQIADADYMIGMHAGGLIRDGGTMQIGIGSLGDAICYGAILRDTDNDTYQAFMKDSGISERFGDVIEDVGGAGRFEKGLYGLSEMVVNGFMQLYKNGLLRRKVYDDLAIQTLLNQGKIGEAVSSETLRALLQEGAIGRYLSERDVSYLKHWGILKPDCGYASGNLTVGAERVLEVDLEKEESLSAIAQEALGSHLQNGVLMHGGFFIGPQDFYKTLRDMSPEEHAQICMTSIAKVNQLYGGEALRAAQRQHTRFFNTSLMLTVAGSAVSDGLEDGRVVSGVGGQYNFVSMAHALPGARSILMCRSNRTKNGECISSVVWNYGHDTVPRHLRDIVVTEYGIADLRSKMDWQVYTSIIHIADSRFQEELLNMAKSKGKVPTDYQIPEIHRRNTPERLREIMSNGRKLGLFPAFPFGTDLTEEELVLGKALKTLKAKTSKKSDAITAMLGAAMSGAVSNNAAPYLKRLGLDQPSGLKDKLTGKMLAKTLNDLGAA